LDSLPEITDFGRARLQDRPGRLTRSGELLGTPRYMAPEQARGEVDIGPAADIHALGVILYELLTGHGPFRADTPLALALQIAREEPPPPSRIVRIAKDLDAICCKCLRKQRDERYHSAAALAEDLERFLAHRPTEARPAGALRRAALWTARNPGVSALLLLLLLVALALPAAGLYHSLRLQQERDQAILAREETQQRNQELDEQTEQARRAWAEASAQRDVARKQHAQARLQRDIARQARAEALWQLDQTRRALYATTLAEVRNAFCTDPDHARHLLDDPARCPLDLRDFAWAVLSQRCQPSGTPLVRHDQTASPDGRLVALASLVRGKVDFTTEARLIDPLTGVGHSISLPPGSNDPMSGRVTALSPDGTLLAVAGAAGEVLLCKVKRGEPATEIAVGIRVLRGPSKPVRCLAFSPTGMILAAGAEGGIHLWTVDTNRSLGVLAGHAGKVRAITFAPGGEQLASAGEDGTVRLWNVVQRKETSVLARHGSPMLAVAFSADARLLAWAAEGACCK
jgi:hypothetical protein